MLEDDVVRYLEHFISKQRAEAAKDENKLGLLSMEKEPECPKAYLLLRKLRMYAGDNGSTPFVRAGGYLDQPRYTTLALEACISAERKVKASLQTQQMPKKTQKEPANEYYK